MRRSTIRDVKYGCENESSGREASPGDSRQFNHTLEAVQTIRYSSARVPGPPRPSLCSQAGPRPGGGGSGRGSGGAGRARSGVKGSRDSLRLSFYMKAAIARTRWARGVPCDSSSGNNNSCTRKPTRDSNKAFCFCSTHKNVHVV